MAHIERTKKDEAMTARKQATRRDHREVLQAKPEEFSREQFAQLYKSVSARILKTLTILAK